MLITLTSHPRKIHFCATHVLLVWWDGEWGLRVSSFCDIYIDHSALSALPLTVTLHVNNAQVL